MSSPSHCRLWLNSHDRETRRLAAILVSDVVGYSRLAGADEDRILARLRMLRSDLIDPTIAVHNGRLVKRTGDGSIIEFRSEPLDTPNGGGEVDIIYWPARTHTVRLRDVIVWTR